MALGANSGLYDMLQEYMVENEHLRYNLCKRILVTVFVNSRYLGCITTDYEIAIIFSQIGKR